MTLLNFVISNYFFLCKRNNLFDPWYDYWTIEKETHNETQGYEQPGTCLL
jgi:hypothetical protein